MFCFTALCLPRYTNEAKKIILARSMSLVCAYNDARAHVCVYFQKVHHGLFLFFISLYGSVHMLQACAHIIFDYSGVWAAVCVCVCV